VLVLDCNANQAVAHVRSLSTRRPSRIRGSRHELVKRAMVPILQRPVPLQFAIARLRSVFWGQHASQAAMIRKGLRLLVIFLLYQF